MWHYYQWVKSLSAAVGEIYYSIALQMGNPMNRSRSTSLHFSFNIFSSHAICQLSIFCPQAPSPKPERARSKKYGGTLFQAGCPNSYSCSPKSGTSNLIRPKVPILSDVISAIGGVNISQFPGSFRLSRQPE